MTRRSDPRPPDEAYFPLERARTEELVRRRLPPPPGVVVDLLAVGRQ